MATQVTFGANISVSTCERSISCLQFGKLFREEASSCFISIWQPCQVKNHMKLLIGQN